MILMTFMVCEFEKGEACFCGEPCLIAGKPVELPENPDVARRRNEGLGNFPQLFEHGYVPCSFIFLFLPHTP